MASDKIKISELLRDLSGLAKDSKDIINKAGEIGIIIKSANSSVTNEDAEAIYKYITSGEIPPSKPKKESKTKKEPATKKPTTKTKPKEPKPKTTKKKEKEPIKIEEPKKEEKRKIIIVSKNTPKEPKKEEKKQDLETISKIMENVLHPKPPREKKPEKPKQPREKKEKLDLNRDLGDRSDDENEVLLFDFNDIETDEKIEEKSEEKITDRVRIQRANPWFGDSIGRERKRRGKKHRDFSNKESSSDERFTQAIKIADEIRVYEFADKINKSVGEVISKLFKMGEMATKNDFLDSTTIEILAQEFGVNIEISRANDELEYLQNDINATTDLRPRAPVVTIMGHVDHGKTSLLDYIRNTRVTKSESGGITQHIGAYMVSKNDKNITFIDTPGHEAFAAMRSRGAQVTDIAIIVIAADDGVKQQTKEALRHAKDSSVQIIIAMNKMDKESANPDKLKAEMAEIGFSPSDWGGEYDFVPVSAKTGSGIDELLDTILIQAEIMELSANIASNPKAVVLEGSLEVGRGPVVTIIVQEGILKIGDCVVAGTAYGRVRALINNSGEKINELKPSQVALLTGLNEVPSAGAILVGVESESVAKEYANKRKSYLRMKELGVSTKVSLDDLSMVVESARLKPLRIILKADTQGTLEALKVSLEDLSNEEIKVNIIASAVGNITESDIDIAQSSQDCYIFGFNVKPLGIIKAKAKELNVSIKSHNVIYNLVDDVKKIIAAMMKPIMSEETIGNLVVRDIFSVGKGSVIAGCLVQDGMAKRGAKARLFRNKDMIFSGNISSLKRFKDDVKEVAKGFECGIMLEDFNDIKVGDLLEIYEEIYTQKQL